MFSKSINACSADLICLLIIPNSLSLHCWSLVVTDLSLYISLCWPWLSWTLSSAFQAVLTTNLQSRDLSQASSNLKAFFLLFLCTGGPSTWRLSAIWSKNATVLCTSRWFWNNRVQSWVAMHRSSLHQIVSPWALVRAHVYLVPHIQYPERYTNSWSPVSSSSTDFSPSFSS